MSISMLMTVGSPKNGGTGKTNTGGKMYGFSNKKIFALIGVVFLVSFMLIGCPDDNPRPPAPPVLFNDIVGREVSMNNDGTMFVSWYPVVGAASYEVYHGGSRFTRDFTWVEFIDDGSTSFTHDTPNPVRFENYYRITAYDGDGEVLARGFVSLRLLHFGPSVLFFDAEYDDPDDIVVEINRIHDTYTQGVSATNHGGRSHFTNKRYLIFFTPGDYHFSGQQMRIGFYTTVAGLGRFPSDTRFHDIQVDVPPHLPANNATQTFWRSIENINIVSGPMFRWAVSQSAPMRRMMVNSGVPTLYHFIMGWGSGGFVADSWLGDVVDGGSQQQWYTRNTHFAGSAMSGVTWNNTIQASTGALPPNDPNGAVTIVGPAPIIRERPFIYLDNDGEFRMFVPGLRTDAVGISWNDGSGLPGMNADALAHNDGMGPGESLDFLAEFFITSIRVQGINHIGLENAARINAELAQGKHIFFVPGRYEIEAPIVVRNPNTIVMGQGWPALWPTPGNRDGVIFVADIPGVTVAGLLFDTTAQSVYSLTVGHTGAHMTTNVPATNPILLADLIMRVGGQLLAPNHVDISVLINSNNVITDKLWLWRADHNALTAGQNQIDWHINTSINGLVVLGNDVHAYGLFVEHYHQYNTLWLGQRGRVFFYQNETPYEPHYQRQFTSHVGLPGGDTLGWAQFKVDNRVTDFRAYGLGMYCVFLTAVSRPNSVRESPMLLQNAIEVPHHPDVVITKAITVMIGTSPSENGILTIVNGVGAPVVGAFGTSRLSHFSDGVGTLPGGVIVNATWSPPDEIHWVEDLIINDNGRVTANPRGGLPYFSIQRGTIGTPGPSWNQPLPPYLN